MRPLPLYPTADDRLRLGAKLRAARQARGMTIDQLASVTGLNKGFISRIERDATSPSVATLITLCGVLDIAVGSLFEAPETQLVHRGDQPMVKLVGDLVTEHLLTPRRQRRLQLTHASVSPSGSGGDELYTVNCQVEVAYVLEGALDIVFAAETTRLRAGDALTFSGHEPHSWRNPDPDHGAEVIWVMIPAPWSTGDEDGR